MKLMSLPGGCFSVNMKDVSFTPDEQTLRVRPQNAKGEYEVFLDGYTFVCEMNIWFVAFPQCERMFTTYGTCMLAGFLKFKLLTFLNESALQNFYCSRGNVVKYYVFLCTTHLGKCIDI